MYMYKWSYVLVCRHAIIADSFLYSWRNLVESLKVNTISLHVYTSSVIGSLTYLICVNKTLLWFTPTDPAPVNAQAKMATWWAQEVQCTLSSLIIFRYASLTAVLPRRSTYMYVYILFVNGCRSLHCFGAAIKLWSGWLHKKSNPIAIAFYSFSNFWVQLAGHFHCSYQLCLLAVSAGY